MKTITYDPAVYKLVPVEPTEESITAGSIQEWIGHPEAREATIAQWKKAQRRAAIEKYNSMLAAVPDQLPGVVAHSGEPVLPSVELPERVMDCLWQGVGLSSYHPNGDQMEKFYEFAIAVKTEVLARLPRLYTHTAPSQPSAEALVQAALEAAEVLSAQNLRTDIVDRIEEAIDALDKQKIIDGVGK